VIPCGLNVRKNIKTTDYIAFNHARLWVKGKYACLSVCASEANTSPIYSLDQELQK